jgi:hypothetical protein
MPLRHLRSRASAAAALLLILATGRANAQARADTTTTSGSARASLLRGGEMGELLTVYVPRNESEVQRLLGDSRDAEQSVLNEADRTRKLAQDADGRARIMKEEMEATRVRRDVARQANDAAALAQLEQAYQRQDRERAYLEDLRDALRADIERQDAERVAAASRTRALELEVRVVQRNRDLTSLAARLREHTRGLHRSPPAPSAEALNQYRVLLREMLEAQRLAAGRWATAAERRQLLAERKIRQLDALTRLAAPTTTRR